MQKSIYTISSILLLCAASLCAQDIQKTDQAREKLGILLKPNKRLKSILAQVDKYLYDDIQLASELVNEGRSYFNQTGDTLSFYSLGIPKATIHYIRHELDSSLLVIHKSLGYFNTNKALAKEKAEAEYLLVQHYIKNQNVHKVDSLIRVCTPYFENSEDPVLIARITHLKGRQAALKRDNPAAIQYYEAVLKLSRPNNLTFLTAKALNNISIIHERQGEYAEAIELLFQVLEMEVNHFTRAYAYDNLGRIYGSLKDWAPSLKYNQMAIDLKKRIGLESTTGLNLIGIATCHQAQLNYGQALDDYQRGLVMLEKYGYDSNIIYAKIGGVYYALGKNIEAQEYFDQFTETIQTSDLWVNQWFAAFTKAGIHVEQKEFDQALEFLLEGLKLAKEHQALNLEIACNRELNKYYLKEGEDYLAKYHEGQTEQLQDSLFGVPKVKGIGALEERYEAVLQQDSLRNLELLSTKSPAGRQQKYGFWVTIGLIILLVPMVIYFLRNQKVPKPKEKAAPGISSKLDHYFEELFSRLDQNGLINYSNDNQEGTINSMSDFLKENLTTANDWKSFEHYFSKIHKDFFKNLKIDYPKLSSNELNMCALLKLNILNKDMAQIMGISPDSVRKAQNRLSKKLDIPEKDSLRDFILKR